MLNLPFCFTLDVLGLLDQLLFSIYRIQLSQELEASPINRLPWIHQPRFHPPFPTQEATKKAGVIHRSPTRLLSCHSLWDHLHRTLTSTILHIPTPTADIQPRPKWNHVVLPHKEDMILHWVIWINRLHHHLHPHHHHGKIGSILHPHQQTTPLCLTVTPNSSLTQGWSIPAHQPATRPRPQYLSTTPINPGGTR